MSSKPAEKRQVVRFAFYSLDTAWRRLSAEGQASSKLEFGQVMESFAGRLLLRPYGLVGIRGDCDFLLWQVAENLDSLVALQTALNRTDLGAYLALPYSYLAMTRRSIYEFPEDPGQPSRLVIRPSEARYLFVYPFIKTRAWYLLPKAERQTMMDEHVRIGRKYPYVLVHHRLPLRLREQVPRPRLDERVHEQVAGFTRPDNEARRLARVFRELVDRPPGHREVAVGEREVRPQVRAVEGGLQRHQR